jgi:lambda repressor-like predicted transcriptional regulator
MESPRLDVYALIAALNAQREARGISWRKLAQEAGVSPSSLTRMQQGKLPDVNTFTALTHWLRIPAEKFLTATKLVGIRKPHPLAMASTLLRGNREMTPEALKALDELMQAAFKFSKELK